MSRPEERDDFLDKLVDDLRSDRPYIERPDEVQVDVGGLCFLNHNRVCGADCTAFGDPDGATAKDRCTILTGMTSGLQLLEQLVQLGRRPARAAAEPAHPPPPDPFAGLNTRRPPWAQE